MQTPPTPPDASGPAAAPAPVVALPFRPRPPRLTTHLLRRLAVENDVDPRSIRKEHASPGSVRGAAGERCRRALASIGLYPPAEEAAAG